MIRRMMTKSSLLHSYLRDQVDPFSNLADGIGHRFGIPGE